MAALIPTYQEIVEAHERIRPYIHRTAVFQNQTLNEKAEASIFMKCENFQKAGAFKSRGACNVVFSLSESDVAKGVCTHSSGNHAAALSRAAKLRGCKAFIVMPENSSQVKIDAVKNYGGEITFCKPFLSSRESTLLRIQSETGATEVHPYNDIRIITAQATAAIELLEDCSPLDVIMAPVGGGGLLSGTAVAVHYFSPGTNVIAAEPKGADDAFRSFSSKKFIPSENPQTIADGLLTSLGSVTFPIIIDHVERIITVDEISIVYAMKLVWERMKIIIEPSSAVPIAAILENRDFFKGKKIGIIISGGNVDLNKLPW
jgi:threonine dehydratase